MRSRLTLLVLATTSLVMIAFLVPLALFVRQVAQDRAIVRATADLQGLVTLVGTGDRQQIGFGVEQLAAKSGRSVTVFLGDGAVLGTASSRTPAVELAARGASLTAAAPGGREIVVAVQGRPEGTAVIRTFLPSAETEHGVTRAWLVLAGLGVLLILVGLAVADRLARSLIRPITGLSEVSHRLANAELTARAQPDGPPELREVAGALNHLAGRIQELLKQEREQVADLSHRLRTPLTALRLEAEAWENPRLTEVADSLERAVSGLILQARRRSDGSPARCDAAAVIAERVAFWVVLAEDTSREVTASLDPGPLMVALSEADLGAAADALLGNIFAHTPDGTPFSVRLSGSSSGAVLVIADHGPGLPGGLLQRGVSGGGSTGLGLDIARRAAEASGGGMDISAGQDGGLVISMRLGSP